MECYSCGAISTNHFCGTCQREFDAGLERAEEVAERSAKLEKAMETGDFVTVGEISAEIAMELAQAQAQIRSEMTIVPTAFVETGE